MALPNAWTFSGLEKFETCPRQFYHTRVKRDIKEPPTEAIKWGEAVHTAMEERVRDGKELPTGMEQWEGLVTLASTAPSLARLGLARPRPTFRRVFTGARSA